MQAPPSATPAEPRVTGHLQVRGPSRQRKWYAHYVDRDGDKHTRMLGQAHVRDSGRRTPRGAVVWRAANGPCPEGQLTPNSLILNTRSAQALTRAGIPRTSWNVINRTGDDLYERLLSGQLSRNWLTSYGTDLP